MSLSPVPWEGDGSMADRVCETEGGKWKGLVACGRSASLFSLPWSFLGSHSCELEDSPNRLAAEAQAFSESTHGVQRGEAAGKRLVGH